MSWFNMRLRLGMLLQQGGEQTALWHLKSSWQALCCALLTVGSLNVAHSLILDPNQLNTRLQ